MASKDSESTFPPNTPFFSKIAVEYKTGGALLLRVSVDPIYKPALSQLTLIAKFAKKGYPDLGAKKGRSTRNTTFVEYLQMDANILYGLQELQLPYFAKVYDWQEDINNSAMREVFEKSPGITVDHIRDVELTHMLLMEFVSLYANPNRAAVTLEELSKAWKPDGGVWYSQCFTSRGDSSAALNLYFGCQQKTMCRLAHILSCFHNAGFVHRDFHSLNVVCRVDPETCKVQDWFSILDDKNKEDLFVLLDFQLSRHPGEDTASETKKSHRPPNQGKASIADDVYSFGVICYELLFGSRPPEGSEIVSFPPSHKWITDRLSPNICDLLVAMLHPEANKRPYMEQVIERLQQPWDGSQHISLTTSVKKIATSLGVLERLTDPYLRGRSVSELEWWNNLLGDVEQQQNKKIADEVNVEQQQNKKALDELKAAKAAAERERDTQKAQHQRELMDLTQKNQQLAKLLEEAKQSTAQQTSSVAPLSAKLDKVEIIADVPPMIQEHRPAWLPQRVARNALRCTVPPPEREGRLISKMVLARDNTPLMEMVKIPAGEFWMGTDPNAPDPPISDRDVEIVRKANKLTGTDPEIRQLILNYIKNTEMPQRRIYLDEYWADRTPVTNWMWQKFLEESGYTPNQDEHDGDYLKHWSNGKPPEDRLHHPVVNVSYMQAWFFCDFYGLMLPSEAQWEKAARGIDGRIWPWGNQKPDQTRCNFNDNVKKTTAVGQYGENGMSPYGLVDCAGNAWEWCADEWNGNYFQNVEDGCKNPLFVSKNRANFHSLRSGGFFGGVNDVRCASRRYRAAPFCCYNVGFRVFSPGHKKVM